MTTTDMERYSIITEKNPREIVLLRGSGCNWRRCRFCDYHLDFSTDQGANHSLNSQVLKNITGLFHRLEVINSGSFCDLPTPTMAMIREICRTKNIRQVHFECHWKDREHIPALRKSFTAMDVTVKVKIGVETFDPLFRESYLDKGIDEQDPAQISRDFDECCLLQGLPGQTEESMRRDIQIGLKYFERVCVNIMTENSGSIHPDPAVIRTFVEKIKPEYQQNPRVDILMENTDFGVGAPQKGGIL